MATTLVPFAAPTPTDIRDANLRVRRNGLIARGVTNPNVTPDSDHFVYATALAQNIAPAYQNLVIKADQQMPDSALDADLVRLYNIFIGDVPVAVGSSGSVVANFSATSLVPLNAELQDEVGQVFQVTVSGNYNSGDLIPILGLTTGKGTDHETGDVLQWVVPPANSAATAIVAAPGLIGGADALDNEHLRALLISHLQNPPGGGNWSQVQGFALKASPSVTAAFVYPALNGPSTFGLCVLGALTYAGANGFTREVTSTVLAAVDTYVKAQTPGPAPVMFVTTTPTDTGGTTPDVDVDVAIGLSLPESVAAGGAGGGWIDAVPWPNLLGAATRVTVSVVTDSTHLTLTSDDPTNCPSATNLLDGVTQIAWFSPVSFAAATDTVTSPAIITATVISHSGTTGALNVVLDTPLTGILAGDFVFPNSENVETYAQAFLAAMGNLGPGQWSSNPGIVPTANRRPLVTRQQPSDITSSILKAVEDTGDEVQDTAFLFRSSTTPGIPPNTTTASPFVFVPRRFGFYDKIP
jgi:uncharacterized phage protein gp47/JayE